MVILNATQSSITNSAAEQTTGNPANVIIGVVLLASALFGCRLVSLRSWQRFLHW